MHKITRLTLTNYPAMDFSYQAPENLWIESFDFNSGGILKVRLSNGQEEIKIGPRTKE